MADPIDANIAAYHDRMAEPTPSELADGIVRVDGDRDPDAGSNLTVEQALALAAALRSAEEEIRRLKQELSIGYGVPDIAILDLTKRAEKAESALAEMRSRFPEGMEHCTIQLKECEKGHGRLTATNWIDHGCPYCIISEVRQSLEELIVNIRSQRRLT